MKAVLRLMNVNMCKFLLKVNLDKFQNSEGNEFQTDDPILKDEIFHFLKIGMFKQLVDRFLNILC